VKEFGQKALVNNVGIHMKVDLVPRARRHHRRLVTLGHGASSKHGERFHIVSGRNLESIEELLADPVLRFVLDGGDERNGTRV
jgi:hypothetical protein